MKPILLSLFVFVWLSAFLSPEPQSYPPAENSLVGAWELTAIEGEQVMNEGLTGILSCSAGYWSLTFFSIEKKSFEVTTGGTYTLEGNALTMTTEFHSRDTSQVGGIWNTDADFSTKGQLSLTGEIGEELIRQTFTRIDAGEKALAGAWQMRARERNGEMQERRPGPRKTVKLLTGTRFQWIAMNTETKQFSGTGGGTYTFEDGIYTEHIEFFSRDSSRVGMSLPFDGRVEEDDWHHSGKSSKGDPIYEIWHRE